jgi:hypothetical protein
MLENINTNAIKSVRGRVHRSTNGQVFKSNAIVKRNLDVGSFILSVNSVEEARFAPGNTSPNSSENRLPKRQDPVTSRDEQTIKSKSEPTGNSSASNENRDSDSTSTTGGSKSTSKLTADSSNTVTSTKDQVHAP